MQGKEMLKKSTIRHAEYYNMVEVLDRLYAESTKGKVFKDLISIISSDANIKMAYRNLKNNDGSNTAGVDGVTFKHLRDVPESVLVGKVKEKIHNYQPKAVRRVYIPKPNGKLRPLGIPTVIDRIVQQSVLQIMEPICEAKFYDRSYGFRPNRSTSHAVAMCYKLAQLNGFHYVVDVDIKGFFDNVDHGKLLKQIWTLGIRDKRLISLISKMLKAPIEDNGSRSVPERGTPQGGVLSPLLANIVLNELDWWVASQWENMPVHNPSPSDIYTNKNGTDNKGNLYKKLKATKLKECHLIRYADDFKIFCKSYKDAVRLKYAVEKWLMDRLKLETSKEKSKITNLKTGYSDFLGIRFKLIQKGKKWVIKSHMTEKALTTQQKNLKLAMHKLCRAHAYKQEQQKDVIAYNQKVVGMHQYYSMATMICEDVHKLFSSLDAVLKHADRHNDITKDKPEKLSGAMDEYFYEQYKGSKQIRYINGIIIVPVAYARHKNPMCHSPSVNRYTESGRETIHKMLRSTAYAEVLDELSKTEVVGESIEFCDNRLSRFVACQGKCELSKTQLLLEEVACIRLIPKCDGGTDMYSNLRIVHKDVVTLRDTEELDTMKNIIERLGCVKSAQIQKINKWRAKIGRTPISLGKLYNP